MKINDAVMGGLLLVLAAAIGVYVSGFPGMPGQRYGAALFPGMIAAGFAVCGALLLARGRHGGRVLLSEGWIDRMMRPCPIAPWYGMLVWLNGERRRVYPAASDSSVFLIGAGGHVTWIDPSRELVVASRWVKPERTNALFARVAGGIDSWIPPTVDSAP